MNFYKLNLYKLNLNADELAVKLADEGITNDDPAEVVYDRIEDIAFDRATELGFDLEDDDVQGGLWELADRLTHAVMNRLKN